MKLIMNGYDHSYRSIVDGSKVSPTIAGIGLGMVTKERCFWLIEAGDSGKGRATFWPMSEINAIDEDRKPGLVAVSTFSGAGGTSTGLKALGIDVAWANEIQPNARECYLANHPNVTIDPRSIEEVTADDVRAVLDERFGSTKIDIFEGSPPCDTFSTGNKNRRGDLGVVTKYKGKYAQRTSDLFFRWIDLARELQPRAIIGENVEGMTKGNAKAYLKLAMQRIVEAGYYVAARVMNARLHGIPQNRPRVIIIAFRKDHKVAASRFERPLPRSEFALRDVIDLDAARDRIESWIEPGVSGYAKISIDDLKRIGGFPDDYVLTGSYEQQWERIGQSVPPPLAMGIGTSVGHALKLNDMGGIPVKTGWEEDAWRCERKEVPR